MPGKSLVILAFTLAVKSLPPFRYKMQGRLVVHEDLDAFAFTVKRVTNRRILVSFVLGYVRVAVFLGCVSRALHHFFNVDACRSNRKQTDRCQHGVTSAHIVRDDKGLVAFFGSQLLKGALRLIRRSVNAFASFFFAVFLLQFRTENTECDSRLCRCAGFGDDVDGEVLAFNQLKQVSHISGANVVTRKIDFRCLALVLRQLIIERVREHFDGRACPEIGASDSDNDQDVRIVLDFGDRFLDAREFFFIILRRQVDPAQIIGAGSRTVM